MVPLKEPLIKYRNTQSSVEVAGQALWYIKQNSLAIQQVQ